MSMISAQQFEENEEYEKAFEEYKKEYDKHPNNPEVIERLGHISTILKKLEDAETYYKKLLEIDPRNELAYEQLMDIYMYTDKYKYYISRGNWHIIKEEFAHALNDYKKAIAKAQNEKETTAARFILATLYEKNGKFNNAIDEYLRVTESEFATEITYLNLAGAYLREDALTSAIETLERAVEKGFNSPIIKENLANLYLKNNDTEKTRQTTDNELVKIKSYLDEGNDEKAYELLEKIDDSYKKDSQYYILKAQYYYNKKEWDKSLECVEEFANFGQNAALVFQMRALIYEGKNMEYEAHFAWARYNLVRGNKDVALNEYYIALKERKDDPELIRELAQLLDDMGDKVQAAEFWQELIKLDDKDKKALERVAEFKNSIGAYKEELEILEKLYNLNKKNTIVIKKIAQTCEKTKQKQKALEYYKKYLENSLIDDEYHNVEQKVQSLEGSTDVVVEEDEGLIGKIMKIFAKK